MCIITKTSLIETKNIGLIIRPSFKIIKPPDPLAIYDHNGEIMKKSPELAFNIDFIYSVMRWPRFKFNWFAL